MTIEPSPEGPSFALRDSVEPVTVEEPSHGVTVDKVATRMSEREIATALDLGHVAAFGARPTPAVMSVAWAMVCHETGRGQKGLYNYNVGNVDAAQGWTGDRFSLTADEGEGAATHAQMKWLRSYPDPYSGAAGWWRYLAEHHATALALFATGDGERTADALKKSGYFTGSLVDYRRELRLMAAEYLQRMSRGGL